MKHLLSPKNIEELRLLLKSRTLLAFDFDGTLAPIVKKRERASLPAGTARSLKALAGLAPVALLSGRELKDLKSKVPFPLLVWIGNHGMEGVPGHAPKAESRKVVEKWAASLSERLPAIPGSELENKRYSLTLHYRESPKPSQARRALLAAAGALDPRPQILSGKKVVNLLAPGHVNKGIAIRALLKAHAFEKALFVGDDDTDEDVFRLRDPRILSVRVGFRKSSSASFYLKNQKETEALLRVLLSILKTERV